MSQKQVDLADKTVKNPEKPWSGICCKACWFAHGERCTCRCHKANHGKGYKPVVEAEAQKQAQKLKELIQE